SIESRRRNRYGSSRRNGAAGEQSERQLNLGYRAGENRVVDESNGANRLNVDGLQTQVVLGLRGKRNDGVGPATNRGQIERRRNTIPLRIYRCVVVTRRDNK